MSNSEISLCEKLEKDIDLITDFMSDKAKVRKIFEDEDAISKIGKARVIHYVNSSLNVISRVISESKRFLDSAPIIRKDFENLVGNLKSDPNFCLSEFDEKSRYKDFKDNHAEFQVILTFDMLPSDYIKNYFSSYRTKEAIELRKLFISLNLSLKAMFIWRGEIDLLLKEFKKYQSHKPKENLVSELEERLTRFSLQSSIYEKSAEVLKKEFLSPEGYALIKSLNLYSELLSKDCEKVREELTYEKNRLTFLGPIEVDLIEEAINPKEGLKALIKYRKM